MCSTDLLARVNSQPLVSIDGADLAELLELAETLQAVDTCLSGWIRILALDGQIVVQEETPQGETLLRRCRSTEVAQQFVAQRLAVYERMWDGCGCKIDYRQPLPDAVEPDR